MLHNRLDILHVSTLSATIFIALVQVLKHYRNIVLLLSPAPPKYMLLLHAYSYPMKSSRTELLLIQA